MLTIKVHLVQVIQIRPTTQASYMIDSGTTMQENQPAAQIAVKHSIFPQMAHICHESFRCWWESIPGSLAWEVR